MFIVRVSSADTRLLRHPAPVNLTWMAAYGFVLHIRRCGVPLEGSAFALRHTFAVRLLSNGIGFDLASVMRHKRSRHDRETLTLLR